MTSDDLYLYARAILTATGGVHSPVRAFHGVGGTPVFFASADGARLTVERRPVPGQTGLTVELALPRAS